MTLARFDNFYTARSGQGGAAFSTLGYTTTGAVGSNLYFSECPSGYGWAIRRPTSAPGQCLLNWNAPAANNFWANTVGMAGIFSFKFAEPYVDGWHTVLACTKGNERNALQYNPFSNRWRFMVNVSTGVGLEFTGPEDTSVPFEAALEWRRNTAGGYMRAWFNGVLAGEVVDANTGSYTTPQLGMSWSLLGTNPMTIESSVSNIIAWNPETRPYPGRRIVQTLTLVADLQKEWPNPANPTPAYTRLIMSPVAQPPVVNSNILGRINIYDVDVLGVVPQIIEAVAPQWHLFTGQVNMILRDSAGDVHLQNYTPGIYYSSFLQDSQNQPWTAESVNTLMISHEVTGTVCNVHFMHVNVLRSLEEAIPTGNVGRAFIISS